MKPLRLQERWFLPKEDHICWAMNKGATQEDAARHWEELQTSEHFANDEYIVVKRPCPEDMNPGGIEGLYWLSIRRVDTLTMRKWTDMQAIKNMLLGPESEAVEVFPAESRKADGVNQYHLFGGVGFKFLVGFGSSVCSG